MRISPISNNIYKPNFGALIIRTSKEDVESELLRHFDYQHNYGLIANYHKKSSEQKLQIDKLLDRIKILKDSIEKEGIEKCFNEKLVLLEEISQIDRDIEYEVENGKEFYLEKNTKTLLNNILKECH